MLFAPSEGILPKIPLKITNLDVFWGDLLALGDDKALDARTLPLVMGVGARQVQRARGTTSLHAHPQGP